MKKRKKPYNIVPTKLSHIIEIPKIEDEGSLCFAESDNQMPFPVKRFYYILNVKEGAARGFHAHKKTEQVLFCIKGSITVVLDNGEERERVTLDQPNHGLFLGKLMWHEMVEFKEDTVLLVAASDYYYEADYLRDYSQFLQYVQTHAKKWYRLPQFVHLSPLRKLRSRHIKY